MSLDTKSLKKLASVCRKAGIKSYKCADFEFILTDDMPVVSRKSNAKETKVEKDSAVEAFESDTLTENELMFWSTNPETTVEESS